MARKKPLPEEISLEDYQRLIKKKRRPKYNNIETTVDGIIFDSILESQDYLKLKDRLEHGEISDLILQPRYELQPSFKYRGRTIRKIEYVADFQFVENDTGQLIAWDSKGRRLPLFNLKEKLFFYKYGDSIELRVVGVKKKPKKKG